MEWKWNGQFSTEEDNVQENGNGMEKNMTNQVEAKFNEMERKWNGNEMGLGWNWFGNGMKKGFYNFLLLN